MDDNCGEWVEYMGVASGCGCKEVYRFPHITYPYSSCICSFLQQHPYFLFNLFYVFHSCYNNSTQLETCGNCYEHEYNFSCQVFIFR